MRQLVLDRLPGQIQVASDLRNSKHRVELEDDQERVYPYDVHFDVYPAMGHVYTTMR